MLELQHQATGRRLLLTDEQRRKIAAIAQNIPPNLRQEYITIVKPETVMRWVRRFFSQGYDSSKVPNRKPGRPPKPDELKNQVCRMSRENPTWGYKRIAQQLKLLGFDICRNTVANILANAGMTPDPEKRMQRTWIEFIKQHLAVIWATDFLTVDTLSGCFYILFFIQVETRKVVLGGITDHPTDDWMRNKARIMTDGWDGPLLGAKYLIHDRDTKYTTGFDAIIQSAGIKPLKLPPCSPNLNSHLERFHRSIREELLDHLIILHDRQLRRIVKEYLEHYHQERCHQGLDGQIILPVDQHQGKAEGPIRRKRRLGGLLNYYYRAVA